MTYIFAPTVEHARGFAHDLGLRRSRVTCFGNGSLSTHGRIYYTEDVIHVLPGVDTRILNDLRADLAKTRFNPVVVRHDG